MKNINLDKFSSKNWQFTYDRKMSYQRMRLFNHGYCNQLSNFFDVKIESEVYRTKNENTAVYYESEDHKKAFSTIADLISGDDSEKWLNKIKNTIEDGYADFLGRIESKPEDYSNYSDQQLIEYLSDFYAENDKISLPTWLLYLYVEEVLTEEIKSRLSVCGKSENEIDKILSVIANPTKIIPLDAYHIDLYKVVCLPKSEQKAALKEFSKKFISWGVFDVTYDVPSFSLHAEKIKDISPEQAKKQIREIEHKYIKQKTDIDSISKLWKENPSLKTLFEMYLFYVNFKDWKNYYREQSSYKMRLLLEEIASRIDVSLLQVSFLTELETKKVMLGDSDFNAKEIDSRIEDSALVFLDGESFIVTDTEDLNQIDKGLVTDKVDSVVGSPAFNGCVTGRVKIIFSTKDAKQVEKGDILVSSTTRPDYLPFMKKAAGFVTNEGGMLSHAAIMSRELKKPCVIGTKIATQVFKDGDIIEVNADQGIVRILDI